MINSPESLIEYIKLELGHPVITINVAPEQYMHAINNACDMFIERHRDGNEECFYVHKVTQDDLDKGYLSVPETITDVVECVQTASMTGGSFATDTWQYLARMFRPGSANMISLSEYVMLTQRIQTIKSTLGNNENHWSFEFVKYRSAISMHREIGLDDVIVFRVYEAVDPRIEVNMKAWNDPWLKRYVTQLVKRIWGSNLSKFAEMSLPGGESLNGTAIYEQAQAEIEKLEEELRDHEEIPLPFIG